MKDAPKIGQLARVNPGVQDEDTHQEISGWEGKIIAQEGGFYLLSWTEETLARQPETYRKDSEANDLDATRYYLAPENFTVIDRVRSITDILSDIRSDGSFYAQGEVPAIPLGLTVADYGEIALPLKKSAAKNLFAAATPAPFGRGLETVLDPSVRNAREIDTSRFSITNPAWGNILGEICARVAAGLNVGGHVIADPYKLLIYTKGGFFRAHRDSEKADGMFATLIIGLPSRHLGGQLAVRFDGEEKCADFTSYAAGFSFPYASFFSDCEHELTEVTDGYRVCLVYNLRKVGADDAPGPLATSAVVGELRNALLSVPFPAQDKPMVILLDHQYTPANFRMDALKAADRGRAQALLAAADAAGYAASLGLVTHYQMGELEDNGYYYNNYRHSYWDDEPEDNEKSHGTMSEVYEETTELELYDAGGGITLGTYDITEQNCVVPATIGTGEPIEQEEEGYTGNAGMTIEYWYHYGAVAFWPRAAMKDMLADISSYASVNWLSFYLRAWDDERLEAPNMARHLLNQLAGSEQPLVVRGEPRVNFGAVAGALLRLQEQAFFRKHGISILAKGGSWIDPPTWHQLAQTFGETAVVETLTKALVQAETSGLTPLLTAVQALSAEGYSGVLAATWPELCAAVRRSRPTNISSGNPQEEAFLPVIEAFKLLSQPEKLTPDQQDLARLALTDKLNREYVHRVMPAVLSLLGKHYLAEACRTAAIAWLHTATATKPTAPPDWAKPVPNDKHWAWKTLGDFMRSPTLRVLDFKAIQERRSMLENYLRGDKHDLRWETIRKGSPHTMRIIKTHAAYERAMKHWEEDLKLLTQLGG